MKTDIRISMDGIQLTEDSGPLFTEAIEVAGGQLVVFLALPEEITTFRLFGNLAGMEHPFKGDFEACGKVAVCLPPFAIDTEETPFRLFCDIFSKGVSLGMTMPEERAEAAINQIGLGELAHTRWVQISPNDRSILCTWLGLCLDPDILIAYDPSLGADDAAEAQVLTSLAGFAMSGKVVLLFTNRGEIAESLGDRIALMSRNRILAIGTRDELLALGDPCDVLDLALSGSPTLNDLGIAGDKRVRSVVKRNNGVELRLTDSQSALPDIFAALNARGIEIAGAAYVRRNLEVVLTELSGG
jgi:ABC-type multidrug transport system ATPase subunit